ncbi:MAG: hypothetical protein JWQ32_1632 [Marmoricola sp.]|nr:hypothetical protein [Marmoricola sp.]
MSDRRNSTATSRAVVAGVVALVLVAAAVYWFAIRDTSSSTPAKKPTVNTSLAQTFKVTGVPFTFKYPGTFSQAKTPTGFIWIAGISPVDILDVRRVDGRAYSPEGLKTVFGTRLRAQSGVKIIGTSTDLVGTLNTVSYTVTSGTTTPLQSKLVYFSTGGSTWQFECQSQALNRAAIDIGCAQALATFTVS